MSKKDINLIIERAKKKDEKAFSELYDMYSKRVYTLINKIVKDSEKSNDVLAISMYKAFNSIDKYKPDYSFMTWLGRVARNASIDYIRKEKKHSDSISIDKYDDSDDENDNISPIVLIEDSHSPFENMVKIDKIEFVHTMISKIPPKYQPYINLKFIEEKSYDEMCDILDKPLGTVKGNLFSARTKLKKVFEDSSNEFKDLIYN
jgi:RNA polymerase sigma-70 factor (ECF subfamily)